MLIKMIVLLKRGNTDESNPRYHVGGFKKVPNIINMVNVIKTTAPQDVETEIDHLLETYQSKKEITFQDIIDFHVRFERIHPYGDGRVGRMIMFKECLRNDILPFVVLDQDKTCYLRGLREYDRQPNYLIETCLHEQDIYENVCQQLLDFDLDNGQKLN
ncbi:MAG: Fic family protein [[Clostridium] innocuum]|nr:Fic family protein [[Clostridium] innocuum]MBS5685873.1 Fic family protein [[Clostridium] innocuum]